MTKKNWEIAKKLVGFCESSEPKLDYTTTLNQLANGLATFDGEELTWVAPKLTKPEQVLADMKSAAHTSVEELMGRADFKDLKVETVVKLVCVRHPEMSVEKPQIFKRIIREVIQQATAPAGVVLQDGDITMKESEINPAMREWAEKNGIKIIPLPEQTI